MYEYFFELWGKQPDVRDEDDLIIDILSIASQKEKLQSPLLRGASVKLLRIPDQMDEAYLTLFSSTFNDLPLPLSQGLTFQISLSGAKKVIRSFWRHFLPSHKK